MSLQATKLGDRIADAVVDFTGTWWFIGIFFVAMVAWIVMNATAVARLFSYDVFDPYPYILWNLVMSTQAVVQGALILMSNRRQAMRDQVRDDLMAEQIAAMHRDHVLLMKEQRLELIGIKETHDDLHRDLWRLIKLVLLHHRAVKQLTEDKHGPHA